MAVTPEVICSEWPKAGRRETYQGYQTWSDYEVDLIDRWRFGEIIPRAFFLFETDNGLAWGLSYYGSLEIASGNSSTPTSFVRGGTRPAITECSNFAQPSDASLYLNKTQASLHGRNWSCALIQIANVSLEHPPLQSYLPPVIDLFMDVGKRLGCNSKVERLPHPRKIPFTVRERDTTYPD